MQFVGDFDRILRCARCAEPWDPETAKQCSACESAVCEPCTSTRCPNCPSSASYVNLPRLVRSLAESVKVYCPNKPDGCDWTGTRTDLKKHECSYQKKKVEEETLNNFVYVDEAAIPSELQCPLCHVAFLDPVQLPCEHVFCRTCITAALKKTQECPCDRSPAHASQLSNAPKMIRDMVDDLPVRCFYHGNECEWVGPRREVRAHAEKCDKKKKKIQPSSPSSSSSSPKMLLEPLTEFKTFNPMDQEQTFFTMAHITAPRLVDLEQRKKPLSISAVIDVSGSMSGAKLKMAQDSLRFMIDELTDRDELGIIAFHTEVAETIVLTKMDSTGKRRAKMAVDSLRALNRTNLSGGLFAGMNQVQHLSFREDPRPPLVPSPRDDEEPPMRLLEHPIERQHLMREACSVEPPMRLKKKVSTSNINSASAAAQLGFAHANRRPRVPPQPVLSGNNGSGQPDFNLIRDPNPAAPDTCRCVLLFTDGIANGGITDESQFKETLQGRLKDPRTKDMTIHTIGFGADHNARMLQGLAEIAGGSYYYIQDVASMKESFADCLGGLLSTVAQNISLTIKPSNSSFFKIEKVLTDFKQSPVNPTDGSISVSMKDVYSSEKRDVLVKVSLAPGGSSLPSTYKPVSLADFSIKYDSLLSGATETVSAVCTMIAGQKDGAPAEEPNQQVLEQRTRIEATEAMAKAREMADAGQVQQAQAFMVSRREALKKKCASSSYVSAMCDDMAEVEQAMDSTQEWMAEGSKQMAQVQNCHAMQRMNRASESKTSLGYDNEWKHAMRAKSRKC